MLYLNRSLKLIIYFMRDYYIFVSGSQLFSNNGIEQKNIYFLLHAIVEISGNSKIFKTYVAKYVFE